MKKHFLGIIISLAAFAVSSVLTWAIYYKCTIADPTSAEDAEICTQPIKPLIKSGKVEFIFKGFVKDGETLRPEFELINGSAADIRYWGHSKSSYCTVNYKRKNKIEMSPGCCGTGLVLQTLSSGDSQTFSIWLFNWKDVNQIGFRLAGDGQIKEQVVWSGEFRFPDDGKNK